MVSFTIVGRFLLLLSSLLIPAAAQGPICGTLGYHDDSISYYGGNFWYGTGSTFTVCAAFCKNDPTCEAFRYSYWTDSGSQYCEFFDVSM